MRKILCLVLLAMFIASTSNALTMEALNTFELHSATAISLDSTGSSETFYVGGTESASFQCVWASVGGSPIYELQASNDLTNWDDVEIDGSAINTTILTSSGSETWIISTLPVRYARINIDTTGSAGTLTCKAGLQGVQR